MSLKFGPEMLGIPKELFDIFENSVVTSVTSNRMRIRDFVQRQRIDGKMVTVRSEKYLEEMVPDVRANRGYGLNFIVDILSTYDYLGLIDGVHVLHRPEYFVPEGAFLPEGEDPLVPESFIYVEVTPDGENVVFEINESEMFKETVKLPNGTWVVRKEWPTEELMKLRLLPLGKRITSARSFDALQPITKKALDDALDVRRALINIDDANVVRHMFTAIYLRMPPAFFS